MPESYTSETYRDIEMETFTEDHGPTRVAIKGLSPRHVDLLVEGMRSFAVILPKGHTDQADARELLDILKELTRR